MPLMAALEWEKSTFRRTERQDMLRSVGQLHDASHVVEDGDRPPGSEVQLDKLLDDVLTN